MPRWLSLVERLPRKQQAAGSKPARGSICGFVERFIVASAGSDRFIRCCGVDFLRLDDMQFFSHSSHVKLRCPYKGCEKHFEKPSVVTDTSVIPRQTHYVCPYCMSRLELVTEKSKVVDVRAVEYPMVFDSPAKCAHFNGLLNAPPGSTLTLDDCLVCPKVLQCSIRRK